MAKSWKEDVLKEYPRLGPESKFRFACHPGLACFTGCCADVNIVLTPYDVLRLKKALKLSSRDFLDKYTVAPFMGEYKVPLVLLRMRDDARKSCPFITPQGCSVYEDRPWACRMFPLETTSAKKPGKGARAYGQEFHVIVQGDFNCLGFKEDKEWTVAGWRQDQGIDAYDKKSKPYREIIQHPDFKTEKGIGASKTMMFYLTCYDLDRFRSFIFESTFLHRFAIPAEVLEKIKTDDEALLDFGYQWLKFSLFGEDTIKVKGEVLEEEKKKALLKSKSTGRAHAKRRKSKPSG
jgi:Fe-S-cluster containining protein